MRKKIYIREFKGWLVANLLLPLASPFVIAFICVFFAGIVSNVKPFDFKEMLDILLDKGVYAFLSITILLSLYQDYQIANGVIKGVLMLPFACFLLGLGFLFIDSLGLTSSNSTFSVTQKRDLFLYLSGFSIVFAVVLKLKIINHKIKQLYSL
ncbi:MAG: hypothetical protein LBO71_02975 [Prevotellaceae bacterium]|jgi:hypothetical protein|nr:hypothetical protein [Prevotellaceae bacterium]